MGRNEGWLRGLSDGKRGMRVFDGEAGKSWNMQDACLGKNI